MKKVLACLISGFVLFAQLSVAQKAPAPIGPVAITFGVEHAGLLPPVWGLEVAASGKGRYYERDTKDDTEPSSNRWSDISISPATMTVLQAGESKITDHCETKAKHIAYTGKKTLNYWHGGSPYGCTFNYSDDEALNAAANAFQAIAETIRMGEKLKHNLRFDRLGLDAEMDALVEEVRSGNAIEIQNIAPLLQTLVDDERVMERVKRKAGHLLEGAGIPIKTS